MDFFRGLLLGCILCGCHGSQIPTSQLIVFRELPHTDLDGPHHLIIRSSYKGSVEFIESEDFHIEVNVTAASTDDLAKVHYNFSDFQGSVLLQLFDREANKEGTPIIYILFLLGGVTGITFLVTLITVCWWNAVKRPIVERQKLQDSSQAPLLEGRQGTGTPQGPNGGPRVKKKKKKPATRQMTSEEYISSEDDLVDNRGVNAVPNRAYLPNSSPRKGAGEPPLYATINKHDWGSSVPLASSEGLTSGDTTSRGSNLNSSLESSKPVVQYIKVQGEGEGTYARRGPQYTTRSSSGDSSSDQSTLKIRRDTSQESDPSMPDVVRSRAVRGADGRDYYTESRAYRKPGGRYIPLNDTVGEMPDKDYSSSLSHMSGAQIASILTDRATKGSPKYAHGQERPPVTFRGIPPDPDLEHVELDSVGSSRSGESSSGTRTAGSFSDSVRSEGDSVQSSTTSSGARSKEPYYDHRKPQYLSAKGHPGEAGGPRVIDEAYGTMGSNGSGSLRSGSTASMGSGSSGSVVTVIQAEDPNSTLSRRRMYSGHKQQDVLPHGDRPPGTQPGQDNQRGRGGGRGGGPRPGLGPKYLHASLICCLGLVCLATGVYSQFSGETEVNIKVFAPARFLKYKPEVYVSANKQFDVRTKFELLSLSVDKFVVEDPILKDFNVDLCRTSSCTQGCDPNSGACICREGYRLVSENKCEDIDECRPHQVAPCPTHAQCSNTFGSYHCVCMEGFYGNGAHCEDCDSPCRNGSYEVMACSDSQPKICKECTKQCMDGYYISDACAANRDTQCKPCSEKCKRGKYEFSPCIGTQDRSCRPNSDLRVPTLSKNLISEDRSDVKQVLSYVLHQDKTSGPLTHMLNLNRGSGFSVHVTLKEANLAPLFKAVDHRSSNDNGGFNGDVGILQAYCPHPVPEKYQLSLVLHQGVTSNAQYYSCNSRKRSAHGCKGETGWYLNPKEPCETYSQFGRLPSLNQEGWSILCTKPGKLSNIFGVSSQLTDLTTMFVDKEVNCAEKRTNCEACLTMSARTMQSHRGSHRCNITGEDSDNGESPRLEYCFSCLSRQECAKMCEIYHNPDCNQQRCVTGNLAEFVLSPAFSHRGTVFACNIKPAPKYRIYDIEYTVVYKGKVVNERRIRTKKLFDKVHPEKAKDVHNFLTIYYGSVIQKVPDLIEGDSSLKSFSAGYYQAKGTPMSEADISTRSLYVRPNRPFQISTKTWKEESCDTDVLTNLMLVSTNPPDSDPYKPDPGLEVQYASDSTYRIFNKTESSMPYIYFEVPRDQSVLMPMYDDTSVRDDDTLNAELTRNDRNWVLNVSGQLQKCPGAFGIQVRDPGYVSKPLYLYDVGVNCPATFSLEFTVPTDGDDKYDKEFKVDITDSFRTIRMTVFRPAPNITQEQKDSDVNYEGKGETEMTIFTPFIAVLCVIISFLAILLFIGFITDSGKKSKKSDNKVHSQHLLFVVCFVTFRAAYSIILTFTVLLLLIRHVNRESIGTLVEFSRYAETAENNQKLEIDKIQSFVLDELIRQNDQANNTKFECEQKLQQLQSVLEDTKQQMRIENIEDRMVSQVALQYTKLMILNLTNSMNMFKQEFTIYSRKALDRLTRSIVQTSSALQSNKWLAGAKIIYDVVASKREGQGIKQFPEWAGIQQEVERLAVDLSLKEFPMPNLTEYLDIDLPNLNKQQTNIPKISDITLPKNQWYYQYERKPTGPLKGASERKSRGFSVQGGDIISWPSLLAILVVIDLVWFIHRMARTYTTAKTILYGCPSYIDCKKIAGGRSPERTDIQKSMSSKCFGFIKDLNMRVMKTEFVPKLVATATTCCALYLILTASNKLMSVKTLASIGYFESMVAPVETSYRLARTRIKTNVYRINKFEYPFYEELVNVRTKRYQLMLEMYSELQISNNLLHDSEYCAWKKLLNPEETCNCTSAKSAKLNFNGCALPPVTPMAYQKKDFGLYRETLARSMIPYINASRQIVMDTCHLVLIFVAVLVLVNALGTVTWIYLKRFNLLRLKPMFEMEHHPAPIVNHT